MSRLRQVLQMRISSAGFDVRFGQCFCFGAAPALLIVSLHALAQHALRPGEVIIGLLSSSAVALLLVVLGLLLPLAPSQTAVPSPDAPSPQTK